MCVCVCVCLCVVIYVAFNDLSVISRRELLVGSCIQGKERRQTSDTERHWLPPQPPWFSTYLGKAQIHEADIIGLQPTLGKSCLALRTHCNQCCGWTRTLHPSFYDRRDAVVGRLHDSSFKWKIRVRFPELAPTYRSSFHYIYPSFSSPSIGWGT